MYINPNSTIKILRSVPLDITYEHTIYFSSASAQSNYFSGLTKYTFEAQSYQRVKRGYIRIATNSENLYDCNYLMFQNSAFGSKWFYAFIKSVEYVNNGVSEIEFEIDVMQTWFFNYTLKECFVEREHSATDKVGDNIIPEKIETGEYLCYTPINAGLHEKLGYVVDATIDEQYRDILAYVYGMFDTEIVSGINMINFGTDTSKLREFLRGGPTGNSDNMTAVRNGVVNIRIAPETERSYVSYGSPNFNVRNKKLLTYPFCFCYVTNYSGNSAVLPFEFFTNNSANFYLCTDMSAGSPAILIPANYKGIPFNNDEKLTINSFPSVAWSSSYYDYWLSQTMTTKVPNMVTNIVGGFATGALATGGNPIGAAVGAGISAGTSVASLMAESNWADKQPPQAKGTNNGIIDYWNGTIDFCIMTKAITPELRRCIDDYFDKFGYATHRVKIPNRNVRPNWCYTKTVGCTITGSIPCDDMKKICSIYDKGITFWKNGANVGNYSLNNQV